MITYEGLCKKVGFDILNYKEKTEDANQENPFSDLTIEELDFLMDFLQEKEGRKRNWSIYYEGPETRMSDRTMEELQRDIAIEKARISKLVWPEKYNGI